MQFLVLIFRSPGFIFRLISPAIFLDVHNHCLLLCRSRCFTDQQFTPVSFASGCRWVFPPVAPFFLCLPSARAGFVSLPHSSSAAGVFPKPFFLQSLGFLPPPDFLSSVRVAIHFGRRRVLSFEAIVFVRSRQRMSGLICRSSGVFLVLVATEAFVFSGAESGRPGSEFRFLLGLQSSLRISSIQLVKLASPNHICCLRLPLPGLDSRRGSSASCLCSGVVGSARSGRW
jgi:hypothetical protein